jgi:hypothetical protein
MSKQRRTSAKLTLALKRTTFDHRGHRTGGDRPGQRAAGRLGLAGILLTIIRRIGEIPAG